MRVVVRSLPRTIVRRMVDSTERKLSDTNFKHKRRVSRRRRSARYGERRLAEGHDVLLLGHFHEARSWQVPGGEVRLLEAWFTSRRVEWLGLGSALRAPVRD